MGVVSTQGLNFQLVANGVTLDLFKDEEIKISDNITGLFDIGVLPSDFTRTITLPGTKKNNAFFEHVYDISVADPFLFSTNQKVDAYFDFGGIYVASGYLQLNKVNVLANKFIDSYEVTIYGLLSSFAREANRNNLTDLTTLTQYNHSSSIYNITASWSGSLFDGDIVYPLADYGKYIRYDYDEYPTGINSDSGSLGVGDFKPAIRVKAVWDAIFNQYGFTYTSSFIDSGVWDNVYLLCDNNLQYPIYDGVDLEGFGRFKAFPVSGSDTDIIMAASNYLPLTYDNVAENPNFSFLNGEYTIDRQQSLIKGQIKLVTKVSGSAGFPQFTLQAYRTTGTPGSVAEVQLQAINKFFRETKTQVSSTGNKDYTLEEEFTMFITTGSYEFRLKYENFGGTNFTVTNNPGGNTNAYIQVTEVTANADYRVMNIARNLPYGQSGIKQIDFIKGLQKKYNLIIYPSKTKPRHFVVETFNEWYKRGQIKSFNDYIDLNKKIEVVPANNLAVKELNFSDKLGLDLLAQNFNKEANRRFGTTYYVDDQNFFSQGKFEVETTFATSPLRYVEGTGLSGSAAPNVGIAHTVALGTNSYDVCFATPITVYSTTGDIYTSGNILFYDIYLTNPVTGYSYVTDASGDIYNLSLSGQIINYYGTCYGGGGGATS